MRGKRRLFNACSQSRLEAFATFVSVLSSSDPDGFETIPRHPTAAVDLNDPQATSDRKNVVPHHFGTQGAWLPHDACGKTLSGIFR